MQEKIASEQQSAKHLAARAVMAYRAGFPVTLLSVTSSSERPSGMSLIRPENRLSTHSQDV